MTRVCALANKVSGRHHDQFLALERSLDRAGVPFYFYLESGPWSWRRKVEWEYELASAHPKDRFVFIDAFDYLFVGNRAELDYTVHQTNLGFSCDSGNAPWPEPEIAAAYDKHRPRLTPWCWLNGSGPFGLGSTIAEAIKFGLDRFRWMPAETDQTFWTRVYLYGHGELDQGCRMTQTLYDSLAPDLVTPHLTISDGRLLNILTASRPQFLHASGHSWAAIPKELIPHDA